MPQSPLTATLLQSTVLNALSNLLAQLIDQHRQDKPFTLNVSVFLAFVIYGAIVVPPNFYWQRYIEIRFPGFPNLRNAFKSNAEKDKPVLDLEDSLPRKEKPPRRQTFSSGPSSTSPSGSGWRNFAMKFTLDQTVAGVVNIVLFVVLINMLKGQLGIAGLWKLVCDDLPPIMVARLKFRPLVSGLMYTVIPVDRRVVFASACGVIWGVYLSLYAAV
ncbi:uncharacterized protein EURHEDRAFT_414725 [Aspergillus ruber CBS 135680]|uniref:Putative peroxisomal membrane protein 2, pxmp2 n=1 Tax=Aspergillus ruber (strain CBS 135680) TaxID=1388766 RepID=A0A017S950_ASPRC|nr:putative peroxisomal membrane protein 2, pxmp2 [Aspergillus ruber CBS 135680]EYE93154.1 putative peroxisomal membrane protein 2, pxmp2 [Aspergillus ruber CBS 135680]